MTENLYHASPKQDLLELKPQESTHGESWVYACPDVDMAAVFLGRWGGDFTASLGRDKETDLPYINERIEGSFEIRYREELGSIYVLPDHSFVAGQTTWDEEWVSALPVEPIEEISIPNIRKHLLELEQQNRILIVRYPEKLPNIPEDDKDLVIRAAQWTISRGDSVLDQLEHFHPHLLGRVLKRIKGLSRQGVQ